MYKYIIKLDRKENILTLEEELALNDNLSDKIFLNHFFYENLSDVQEKDNDEFQEKENDEFQEKENDEFQEKENDDCDYFLFYQSSLIQLENFLAELKIDIPESNIEEVEELSDNLNKEFDRNCPELVYITNYPENFESTDMLELITKLPGSKNTPNMPKIEKIPCVFKILFPNSTDYTQWIKSILCYVKHIHFKAKNICMSAETNCIRLPVIHFIDLPPIFKTVDLFIETMKNDLGNFTLYEENEQTDEKHLSCNISYKLNDEAWDVIDQSNLQQYKGRELRVNHFIDKKCLQEMSKFNIKVTNYEGKYDSFDLYEKFQQFGSIYSIYNNNPSIENEEETENENEVKKNSMNNFFCVQYYKKESAIEAVMKAPKVLNMKNLVLTTKEAGIVVYHFKHNITIEKVKKTFPNATKIVIRKSKDRNSRPYVFISFICEEDCEEAARLCKNIYSKRLRLMCVPQTMSKEQAFKEREKEEKLCQQKNTILLRGIPQKVCAEEIIQKCSVFGKIDSAVVIDKMKGGNILAKISFNLETNFQNAMNSTFEFKNRKIKI